MDPQIDTSYTGSGFNMFMERSPQTFLANDRLNAMTSPFIQQTDENGYLFSPFSDMTSQTMDAVMQQQPISADNIQGGRLTSDNGNLTIDMNQGQISYNDGAQTLFDLGGVNSKGTDNSLSINNSQGVSLLSS